MNRAAQHLLGNLTEREKFDVKRKSLQAVQNSDRSQTHLKEKVMKLGEDAIKGSLFTLR